MGRTDRITMRQHGWVILTSIPFALVACGGSLYCPADMAPGIVVEVRDGTTGVPIASFAHGEIRNGSYSDSLVPYETDDQGVLATLTAGRGRSGTYEVRIEAEGYEPWIKTGVVVDSHDCGAVTVRIRADLSPDD